MRNTWKIENYQCILIFLKFAAVQYYQFISHLLLSNDRSIKIFQPRILIGEDQKIF